MRRLVLAAVCAAVLGLPAESGAAVPPPSPCLDGYYCATLTVDASKMSPGYSPGNGRMTSEPAGLDCTVKRGVQSGVCSYTFSWRASGGPDSKDIVVVATAAGDSLVAPAFGIWSKLPITIRDGVPALVNYFHFTLRKWTVAVTKTGAGSGQVLGPQILCGSFCMASIDHGTKIALTATPDAGAVFKAWTGACNGQGATCTLTVMQHLAANAVFELKSAAPPPAPPPPPPTTTTPADTSVDASLLAARAGKSRLGARVVEVELAADEDLAVALTLSRKGKKLALKRFARVKEGRRVLTLVLPKTLRKGIATLGIAADDAAGNRRGWRRTVRVPSRATRHTTSAAAPAPSPCLAGISCATITLDLRRGEDAGNWSPGSGRFTSEPAGLDCTANRGVQSGVCEHTFSWRAGGSDTLVVVLTATADSKSWVSSSPVPRMLGGTSKQTLTLRDGEERFLSHEIFSLARWPVEVTRTGAGTGRVSSPSGIDCGSDCKATVDVDKTITLTAKPDPGAEFKTWTGACNGQGATCTLTVTKATSTNAVFDVKPPPATTTPTPTPTPATDRSVDASVLAARAAKTRLGARVVEVEFAADEDLAVALTLSRKGKRLALKRFARVKQGRRVLTLVLPKTLRKGSATLGIAADDAAGNRKGWRRTVRVPSAGTRHTRSLAISPAAAPTPCRARITAAGHTWAVSTTNGFPCAASVPIVRKLAAKTAPPPVGRYPGTHAGLVCVGRLPDKKPSLIICGTRSRGFTAVRI